MACFGLRFSWMRTVPTQHVRQEYIERHGGRAVLARSASASAPVLASRILEAPLAARTSSNIGQ